MGEVITAYAAAYLGAISAYSGSAKNIALDGVKIPHLFPGTKLNLRPAGTPGGVGTDFDSSLNRHLAANLGVSYEELTKDFTKTNYSGFKGGLNETRKHMGARKKMVADRFATSGYALWFEEAMNSGELETMKGRQVHFYEGLNKDAYLACEWIGASMGQIDELKETQAAALRLNVHLSTYEDELGRLGKDWRKVFRQRRREQDAMDALDLVVVQSPAQNAATGDTRNPPGTENATAPEDERPGAVQAALEQLGGSQGRIADALTSLAARPPPEPAVAAEPPVINLTLPAIQVDVQQRSGKTVTKVLAHDDKGRILRTSTEPVED